MSGGQGSETVEVGVLGPIRARVEGRDVDLGGPRQQALLASLAARAGAAVPNDVIIDAIWDGDPPDGAARTFRSYVARLRRAFDRAGADGSSVIVTASAGYRLDCTAVDTDLFEEEAARARRCLADGEPGDAVVLSGQALERWQGRAFGPFADRDWAAPAAVRLEELRLGTVELRARALLDAGRVAQAVAVLEELAAAEPYRESVARLQATALYRSGRDADAMGALRQFRSRLVEEHGLDPSDQISALESMILDRDPRLDRPLGGRRLRGYVLHEPIARSPLGTVHRAEQPSIGRDVAVTVLPPEVADAPDVVRAFEARLQAVAGINHPNVLPVYDYWREPGAAYVVTRLPIETLDQGRRSGRVTAADSLRVGEQVAAALAVAHDHGVTHGALGLDAVVIDDNGDVSLWAFPVSAQGGTPAADVASVRLLIAELADNGSGGLDASLPAEIRRLLGQTTPVGPEPVVTAAGLAAALSAARSGERSVPAVPLEVGPNPYRGLASFRETDVEVFFGRDDLTNQLLARITRTRAVAVVGASGSGKSSVVRAGLLPRLRDDGAFVTTMVPGTRPLSELEIALSRVSAVELVDAVDGLVVGRDRLAGLVRRVLPTPGADLVLVVDQFEELFTLSDPTERDLLLRMLAEVVADPDAPVRLVLTLRADFLAQALSDPVGGSLIRDRSVMVGPLGDDELHDVIVRPAEVAGAAVEPALAAAVVADAARSPGSLPMVQFALTEVFAAAGAAGVMTLESYRRIGGIEGVLGQRAEEVFASLDPEGQQGAHVLFRRLVTPNDDGPPTRRRALRNELDHVPDRVVERFGQARLLRFDQEESTREPTVEVAHEALFRAWPRLVRWIDEGIDDLRLLNHLTTAAGEWDESGREEAELYRGSRLDAALEFAAVHRPELSATERAFVDAGRRRREQQQLRDRRSLRRLRVLTSGLAVGLVLALVAGTLAWTSSRREQATATSAQVDELAFAATAEVGEDIELASLYAAHAYALAPDIESQAALLDVLDVDPRIVSLEATPEDACGEATGSGETILFARVTTEGTVLEQRTLDQEVIRQFPGDFAGVPECSGMTPDGQYIFDRFIDRYQFYDLDLQLVARRDDVNAPSDQRSMDFHPTEPIAAMALDDGTVVIVDIPSLATRRTLDLDLGGGTGGVGIADTDGSATTGTGLVRALAYSEDGSLLVVADTETVHVVDAGGALVASMPVSDDPAEIIAPFVSGGARLFGHLGRRSLIVASLDAQEDVSEIELGAVAQPYRRAVAVEPGGQRAAVATADGIEVLDLVGGTVVGDAIPVEAGIVDLFWSAPGRLNGIGPNGVYQFDVDLALSLGEVTLAGEAVAPVPTAVAEDGSGVVVLTPGEPSTARFVNATTGRTFNLGPSTLEVPLARGRWLSFDPVAHVVRTGDAAGIASSRTVPGLPTIDPGSDLMGIAANGDRVTVLLGDRDAPADSNDRSFVVVFDGTSGQVLGQVEPADGSTISSAMPIGDDEVLLAHVDFTWRIVGPDGVAVHEGGPYGAGNEIGAVDPESRRYATADWNGDLHVVDPVAGDVVNLPGPSSNAMAVAFAGDDRLVSRHIDGSTYLWDLATRQVIGRLWRSASLGFHPMAVDRAAGELVQSTPAGIARIPLDPDEWFAVVCSRVSRELTTEEVAAVAPELEAGPGCAAS